jgi:hypothetical protein
MTSIRNPKLAAADVFDARSGNRLLLDADPEIAQLLNHDRW